MKKIVRLGIVQSSMFDSPEKAQRKTEEEIRKLARQGAQVMLLQELAFTPYFCRIYDRTFFNQALDSNNPVFGQLSDLARELGVVITFPYFERRAAGLYHNTACVFDADGKNLGQYRKMHIPDDPGFYEKYYFAPGDLGFKVFETAFLKLGILICWDQWYPEAARITALMGAELLYFPTAIGAIPGETADMTETIRDAWITTQRSHAIDNGVHVAAVNRTGTEGELTFWGSSFVADPHGKMLWKADYQPVSSVVDIDLGRSEEVRQLWPYLRDRRIDAYSSITQRFIDK
jgi:N-carbamoylputrescine amidase